MERPSVPTVKKATTKTFGRRPKAKSVSQFNMAAHQLEIISELEKTAASWYIESDTNPWKLYQSIDVLFQAFIIFRKLIAEKRKNKLTEDFENLMGTTREKRGSKIVDDDYYKLRDKVTKLRMKYYDVKQDIGLNLPVDRIKDAELMLEDMTSS